MKCILFLVKVIYIILQQFQVRQRQLYFLLYGQSGNNFELVGQQNNINILNPIQARLLRALKSRSGGGGGGGTIWSPHGIFGLGNARDLKLGMAVVFDK